MTAAAALARAAAMRSRDALGAHQRDERREFRAVRRAGQRGAQRHEERGALAAGRGADRARPAP